MTKLSPRREHGEAVPHAVCLIPARAPIDGTRVRLEPINPERHSGGLYRAGHEGAEADAIWTYLPYGPFADEADYGRWLTGSAAAFDPIFFAVRMLNPERLAGVVSFLNIAPASASIEIGHIWFAPFLQRTPAATEALYLLMCQAFDDLGYRRLEWKCNALNKKSRGAALRLGFAFEGVFFRHMIVDGRNRDSAWFSLLAEEWPAVRGCFESWLDPSNFDDAGNQKQSLGAMTQSLRA